MLLLITVQFLKSYLHLFCIYTDTYKYFSTPTKEAYHGITLTLLKRRNSWLDNRKLCEGWGERKKNGIKEIIGSLGSGIFSKLVLLLIFFHVLYRL